MSVEQSWLFQEGWPSLPQWLSLEFCRSVWRNLVEEHDTSLKSEKMLDFGLFNMILFHFSALQWTVMSMNSLIREKCDLTDNPWSSWQGQNILRSHLGKCFVLGFNEKSLKKTKSPLYYSSIDSKAYGVEYISFGDGRTACF